MFAVITTISEPTLCIQTLCRYLINISSPLVVIGDKKGPRSFNVDGTIFLSMEGQKGLGYKVEPFLPTNHYARKNIGYLYAMAQGADCIYETDDDNAPIDHWQARVKQVHIRKLQKNGWVNIYKYFTNKIIWPRGLPLDQIHNNCAPDKLSFPELVTAPIQQGLVNGSPDVDAIWRLTLDSEFTFSRESSIYLESGAWCPFNSQNTWWWPEAFALMYLPSHCSFRMTDIWRSFIAQRCLWAMGYGIVFHAPDVYQDRNIHNLMRDFEAEVPGYLGNNSLVETLAGLDLVSGLENTMSNLHRCYELLVRKGFFQKAEMDLVEAWCGDVTVAHRDKSKDGSSSMAEV